MLGLRESTSEMEIRFPPPLISGTSTKRFHDVTLQHLEVVKAKPGLFNEWLKSKGKLGGQHKIPRLSNSRKNIDEMLIMNQ